MGKNLLSLTTALACVATTALAQLSVPPGGTPVLTFDAKPTLADGWSTGYATGGGVDITNLTGMDAFAQTLTASNITNALGSTTTWPPNVSSLARWNGNTTTTNGYLLQTRISGIKCTFFMLTMRNDTGSLATSVTVQYDYASYNYTPEEIPGWRVYYSLTGNTNEWVPIDGLYPGNETAAHLSAVLDLSSTPWLPGAPMYILWIDDNNLGQDDGSYTLDNFQVFPNSGPEPIWVVVLPGSAATNYVQQCGSITFHAYVAGGIAPYSYQWMQDGAPIEAQTNSTLVLNNVQPSDAGGYSVSVIDSSDPPQMIWSDPPSVLAVTPNDTVPTLLGAEGGPDASTVTVHFSKPVSVSGTGAIVVREVCLPSTLPVASATVKSNDVVIKTTYPREGHNYEVVLQPGGVTDRCNGSEVSGTAPVIEHLIVLPWDHTWYYDQSGFEPEAGWSNAFYMFETSWPTGPGIFDGHSTPRTNVAGLTVGTQLSLKAPDSPFGSADVPTYYFRTHFNFPANVDPSQSIVTMQVAFDDAAIFYLNGREIWRTPGIWNDITEPFAFYFGPAVSEASVTNINLGACDFVGGENVLAVYLKQCSATSADITMGLQITALVSNFLIGWGPLICEVYPTNTTIPQCGTLYLNATVQGGTRPYSMQWYRGATALTNGGPVYGATMAHLTIMGVQPGDAGNYTLHVTDSSCPVQSVASPPVSVTVVPETAPTILYAICSTDLHTITLYFSTAVHITSATGEDFLIRAEDGSDYVTITSAVVTNSNEVVLVTMEPLLLNIYQVIVQGSGVTSTCSGLHAADGTARRIWQKILLFGLDVNNHWQYNQAGVDLGTDWLANSYDDHGAGWATGQTVLDGNRGAERTTLNGQTVRTTLSTTNAIFPTTGLVVPTYYFRKHFTPPVAPGKMALSCRTFFDDCAILYINGQEAWRSTNLVATNELFASYVESDIVGDANFSEEIPLPRTNMIDGDNVLAVYLKQGTPGSSDITMGLELIATVTFGIEPPKPLYIVNNGNGTATIFWNPADAVLQQSTDLKNWSDSPNQPNGSPRTMSGNLFFRLR